MHISIVIPIYNAEPFIRACLQSVMAQTMTDGVECILVDDCCTDNTMELAEHLVADYCGNIRFTILRHPHNSGLSSARNTGLNAACGTYVYFLDADDELTPDCLAMLFRATLTYPEADVVVGNYSVTGSSRRFVPLMLKDGCVLHGEEIMREYALGHWYQMAVNKLYLREMLTRHDLTFFPNLLHEDEAWSFQVAHSAQCLVSVNRETYVYHLHENSISTTDDVSRRADAYGYILSLISEMVRHQHLQGNIYACLKYFFLQYQFITYLYNKEYPHTKELYVVWRKLTPFSAGVALRSACRYPRRMVTSVHNWLPSAAGYALIALLQFLRHLL